MSRRVPARRRPGLTRPTAPATSSSSCSTACATTAPMAAGMPNLAAARRRSSALELRVVDGAVALQPADGAAAPHQPDARLRVGVLQARLRAVHASGSACPASSSRRCCRRSTCRPTYGTRSATAPAPWCRCRCSTPRTPINRDFDTYELMPTHNDMAAMLDRLRSTATGRRSTCSTSARRTTRTRCPTRIPASGRASPACTACSSTSTSSRRRPARRRRSRVLRRRAARRAARRARSAPPATSTACSSDSSTSCPPRTWIVVTADHGELFGEGGYFGHGPIAHEKVFEVPFVEGLIR